MDLAFGFNEGWSEFWEGAIWGCWGVSIDEALEGNVAFALGQLSGLPGTGRKRMVEILKANPGKIHSLDDFITYLAPLVGRSMNQLTQVVDSARRVPAGAVTEVVHRTISQAQVREVMGREKAELAASIQLAERELGAAREAARAVRPCLLEDCETALRTLVKPIMLQADIDIRKLAGRRLESLTRLVLDESFAPRLAGGQIDTVLTQMREQQRLQIYRVNARALEEARRVAGTLGRRGSAGGDELVREFTAELDSLRARAAVRSGGYHAAGVARMADESATPGRLVGRP
jgi:hypothetical protein